MQEIKRKCLACNKVTTRENLIKITRLKEGTLKINPTSKEIGRSVYVCKNSQCIKEFIKRKKLRALKSDSQSEILKIEEMLKNIVSEI